MFGYSIMRSGQLFKKRKKWMNVMWHSALHFNLSMTWQTLQYRLLGQLMSKTAWRRVTLMKTMTGSVKLLSSLFSFATKDVAKTGNMKPGSGSLWKDRETAGSAQLAAITPFFFFFWTTAAITCQDSIIAKTAVSTVVCTIPPSADIFSVASRSVISFSGRFSHSWSDPRSICKHTEHLCVFGHLYKHQVFFLFFFGSHITSNKLNLICKESCNSNLNK